MKKQLYKYVAAALFSAVICVSAQLQIPYAVPFTMQTFAVALSLMTLGGVCGSCSVIIYLALGLLGLPVFAGFAGGVGALLSPSGGFAIGLIPLCLCYTVSCRIFGKGMLKELIYLAVGLVFLYTVGVLWLIFVYTELNFESVLSLIGIYVLPFVIPDILKIYLAALTAKKIKKHISP